MGLIKFPVQWDVEYKRILISTSIFRCWLPFICLLLCSFLYGNCSGLTAIYIHLSKRAPKIETLLQVLICWILNTVVFTATVLLTNINLIAKAFNKVLQMDEFFSKEFNVGSSVEIAGNTNAHNTLKYFVGPILSLCVLLVPFAYVFTGLDTFNYVLDFFLDDPMYRDNLAIIGGFLARLVALLMACLESFRFSAYAYTLILVLLERWNRLLIIPAISCKNANTLLKNHLDYRIILNTLEIFFQHLVTPIFTLAFWTIVITLWVCVKSSANQIGYLLYYWFVIGHCLFLVGITVVLHLLCNLLELDCLAVNYNILLAKRELAMCRNRENKINKITLLRSKAVRPIKLKYGFFGRLNKDFFLDFYQVLLLRCFDAVLMFDY